LIPERLLGLVAVGLCGQPVGHRFGWAAALLCGSGIAEPDSAVGQPCPHAAGRVGAAAERSLGDSNGQQVLFVLDIPRFEAAARTTMQGPLPEICQKLRYT
jgi:hypothetical protein